MGKKLKEDRGNLKELRFIYERNKCRRRKKEAIVIIFWQAK